jgi:hypothetical protein
MSILSIFKPNILPFVYEESKPLGPGVDTS